MPEKDLVSFGARVPELTDPIESQHVLIPPSASFDVGDREPEVVNTDDIGHCSLLPDVGTGVDHDAKSLLGVPPWSWRRQNGGRELAGGGRDGDAPRGTLRPRDRRQGRA